MASLAEVAKWTADAGFAGTDRPMAIAVALAASRGNIDAPGGLFGIGGGASGPEQAAAAFERKKTGGWAAFPSYRSNAYILWWPTAVAIVGIGGAGAAVTDPVGTAGTAADVLNPINNEPITEIASMVRALTSPNMWNRIMKVGIGLILIGVGAVWFTGHAVTSIGRRTSDAGDRLNERLEGILEGIEGFQRGRQTGQTMGR